MGERDDRVLPAMKWVSFVVVLVLLPALVILWGMPGETADLWSWTIKPELTPIFMGAGYGAGAYFFLRVFLGRRMAHRRRRRPGRRGLRRADADHDAAALRQVQQG